MGKLARQLRLAGFDALLDRRPPDSARLAALAGKERILLTRSTTVRKALASESLIFIRSNDPTLQMRQVLTDLHLSRADLQPLMRCSECNQPLDKVSKDEVVGLVPAYILQQHAQFKQCPQCRRIYWPGSHVGRWLERMVQWFAPPGRDEAG